MQSRNVSSEGFYVDDEHNRKSFEEWLRAGARWAAERADCRRRKVGAIIVRDNRVISTGYNGALPGEVGCLAGGCPRGLMSKEEVAPGSQYAHGAGACIAIHAELNALLDAAKRGTSVEGATMYVTDQPCATCSRLIKQAGISDVDWQRE